MVKYLVLVIVWCARCGLVWPVVLVNSFLGSVSYLYLNTLCLLPAYISIFRLVIFLLNVRDFFRMDRVSLKFSCCGSIQNHIEGSFVDNSWGSITSKYKPKICVGINSRSWSDDFAWDRCSQRKYYMTSLLFRYEINNNYYSE